MVAQAKEAGCPSFKKYFNEFVCLADESCQFETIGYDSEQSVGVAQLVRASDCGSECRGFESPHPPLFQEVSTGCNQSQVASFLRVCSNPRSCRCHLRRSHSLSPNPL